MKKHFFLLFSILFLLTGCISPSTPPLPINAPNGALNSASNQWWKEFNDTNLNSLIENALKENLTLAMAKQRVLQAYATMQTKNASMLPTLNASMSAGGQDELNGVESQKESYTATLTASYEIDIFGKKDDALNSSKASFKATQEALHVSSISISAEISIAWYSLAQKQESLALLQEQQRVAEKILTLTQLKHQSGKNSLTDVWQQEQYIKSLQAQMILLKGDIDTLERSINILLGRSALSPLEQSKNAKLIALPPVPDIGIPAIKLLQRPDVRQAFYNLEAAHFDMAEAIKNQYPSFSLSLSTYGTSTQFASLLDTIIATAAATISGTLYDGGSKEALVKKATFITKERSLNYKQTLLQAFNETLEAQHKEEMQTRYNQQLNERIALAQIIFERQQNKYLYGIVEYLSVLSAQQSLQELEQTKLSKQLENIKYRIALYRSLGGGFIELNNDEEWRNYAN